MSVIRKAELADLNSITKLERVSFHEDSFSRRQLRYLITMAKADFLVTESEKEISSFIVLLKRKNSSVMRIYSVAVSPGHQGKGLAKLLLAEAEKIASENGSGFLSLEVNENNAAAVGLYLRAGFSTFGERPSYYKDGSKALLMRKKIL